MEIDKGLRVRLAPQGITGTNYLEIDYVDPKTNPELPVPWEPDNLYIPSAQSTVTQFVAAASDIVARIQHLDIEGTLDNLNRLLVTTNNRIEAIDTSSRRARPGCRQGRQAAARADRQGHRGAGGGPAGDQPAPGGGPRRSGNQAPAGGRGRGHPAAQEGAGWIRMSRSRWRIWRARWRDSIA